MSWAGANQHRQRRREATRSYKRESGIASVSGMTKEAAAARSRIDELEIAKPVFKRQQPGSKISLAPVSFMSKS